MSLFDRLSDRLAATAGAEHRDEIAIPIEGVHVDAAVLVAVTDRPDPGVILTRRPDWLRRHAGQIAFPGGRIDPGDADAVAAALREAEEEIALPRDAARIVGQTTAYHSGSGFRIVPVVAVVPPDLPLVPDPQEVADIFEVPLAFLLDPANATERHAFWNGRDRRFSAIEWDGRAIWGVTAGIIGNLSRRIAAA